MSVGVMTPSLITNERGNKRFTFYSHLYKDEGSTRLDYTGSRVGTGTPKDRDEVQRREV
jgi:hypothetical protein